ncbi:hypothetical protein QZH41_007902 [Actinostola sp. cb2023]|nr:hypothetical protein QZH41_007902 [Actinostola sp. cb2023]
MSNATTNTGQSTNTLLVIQLFCYSAIIVVGTFGNILIFLTLVYKKKRKISDYFIVNLTITDLLCCIVSIPFDIMELILGYWPLGLFMCKLVYPLQTVVLAVSVITLLFMALERHHAIIHPLKPKIRGKYALLTVILLWITTIALVSPYMLILELRGSNCIENWPGESHVKAFTVCVFVLLYVVPLSIILAAYVQVAIRLSSGNPTITRAFGESLIGQQMCAARSRRNVRVLKIFVSAVIAFAVCLLPFHIMWLWYDFGDAKSNEHYNDLLTFANILVYSNSAVNPFIFGALSQRFRNTFGRGFSLRRRRSSPNTAPSSVNRYSKSTFRDVLKDSFRFKSRNLTGMNALEKRNVRHHRTQKLRLNQNHPTELTNLTVNHNIVMETSI